MAVSGVKQSIKCINVMLVDDSAIIRGLYKRMLADIDDVEIVLDAMNGEIAVSRLAKNPEVDLIVLDIEMPVMDGLTALPLLLKERPGIPILMASTLTAANAEYSLRAMQAGAADFIQKPTTNMELTSGVDFKTDFLNKIRALGRNVRRSPIIRKAPDSPGSTAKAPEKKSLLSRPNVTLRKHGSIKPKVLAVGSSTGGPEALRSFFKSLNPNINVPVVLTQHMPPTFTTLLAEHITRDSDWQCDEAKDGDILKPGRILLAPGGFHMIITGSSGQAKVKLTSDPPVNFCRPSVDPMLDSVVKVFGGAVLTVILTGMGSDGIKGGTNVVNAGGTLIAQDEESSVVWGMPGAAAGAGICSKIAPLNEIATHVTQFVTRTAL